MMDNMMPLKFNLVNILVDRLLNSVYCWHILSCERMHTAGVLNWADDKAVDNSVVWQGYL